MTQYHEAAGCHGLENAFRQQSDDSAARDALIRQMIAHGCDEDSDGVVDVLDLCPNTAAGVQVGNDGCPNQDSDSDGVLDVNNDGSPNDNCRFTRRIPTKPTKMVMVSVMPVMIAMATAYSMILTIAQLPLIPTKPTKMVMV